MVADTHAPLVLYESGFAPRWYVPAADVDTGLLTAVDHRTYCPYKDVASYYDVVVPGGPSAARAAWSYLEPLPEVARIAGYLSFYPELVEVCLDGEVLQAEAGQTVVAHGKDRDLTPARQPGH